jgi:two-component system, cell cycle sensor histidine kinase and response regulator CckA
VVEANETVILLAEDDVLVRNLVQSMLSKEGYSVLAAKDGQEADEICERFAGPIHSLLTDVNMPRMTGPELAEKVRAHRPGAKIMIMSGQTTTAILEENMPHGFLRKPFIPPALLQCVQRVLTSSFSGICHESDVLNWPVPSD